MGSLKTGSSPLGRFANEIVPGHGHSWWPPEFRAPMPLFARQSPSDGVSGCLGSRHPCNLPAPQRSPFHPATPHQLGVGLGLELLTVLGQVARVGLARQAHVQIVQVLLIRESVAPALQTLAMSMMFLRSPSDLNSTLDRSADNKSGEKPISSGLQQRLRNTCRKLTRSR